MLFGTKLYAIKSMNPKVSIIVPVWGGERGLARCVESLVNQTLKDIEIILVDDESPDRVPEMCDEWAKKDSRIKVIHKKNGGLGYARNSGLEIAKGEYVAFLDSDDYVDLQAYETVFNEAIKDNLDVCYFQRRRVDQNDRRIEISTQKHKDVYYGRERVDMYMMNSAWVLCVGLLLKNINVDSLVRKLSLQRIYYFNWIFYRM